MCFCFVVNEPELVELFCASEPHDFGTQIQHDAGPFPFCAPTEHSSFLAPNIQGQLDVLSNFMMNGNLVSNTADAWLRMADKYGIADKNVQKLAALHQKALDSRKSYDNIDQSQLDYMNNVLDLMPAPHYKRGGSGTKSSSLLGILYEFWRHHINAVDILIKGNGLHPSRYPASLNIEVSENKQLKQSTVNMMTNREKEKWAKGSVYKYCVTCGDCLPSEVMKKCAVCGVVWVCVGRCEMTHWRICFCIQWNESNIVMYETDEDKSQTSSTLGSFIDSREITEDTASLTSFDDSEISLSVETRDTADYLIDVVFGVSQKPTCAGLKRMNWHSLVAEDLPTLRQLALVEFYTSFEKGRKDAWKKTKDKIDTPHIFDVFLMEPRVERGNITLAVYVRNDRAGGILTWRDGHGNYYPQNPAFHLFRVASLSGTCRILESLRTTPMPGSLMDSALRRNADAFMEAVENTLILNPEVWSSELNTSQKQAVATICSSRFKDGFFLVGLHYNFSSIVLAADINQVPDLLLHFHPGSWSAGNRKGKSLLFDSFFPMVSVFTLLILFKFNAPFFAIEPERQW